MVLPALGCARSVVLALAVALGPARALAWALSVVLLTLVLALALVQALGWVRSVWSVWSWFWARPSHSSGPGQSFGQSWRAKGLAQAL